MHTYSYSAGGEQVQEAQIVMKTLDMATTKAEVLFLKSDV